MNCYKFINLTLMMSAVFLGSLLTGCDMSNTKKSDSGIKISIECKGANTIGSYFDQLYITDGDVTMDEWGTIMYNGGNGFLQIDATTDINKKEFTNSNQAWKGGEKLTLILYPKEHWEGYYEKDYVMGYKSSDNPTVIIEAGVSDSQTLTNSAPAMKYPISSSIGLDDSTSYVGLNYRNVFMATFTAKSRMVINIGNAAPSKINKSDIRLADDTGISYIDGTTLKQSHIRQFGFEGIESDYGKPVYSLDGVYYCTAGLNVQFELHAENGYKFTNSTTVSARIGSENVNVTDLELSQSDFIRGKFTAASAEGSVIKFTVNGVSVIADAFTGMSFTSKAVYEDNGMYDNDLTSTFGTVTLTCADDKTFTLTWNNKEFTGSYVMMSDYTDSGVTVKSADFTSDKPFVLFHLLPVTVKSADFTSDKEMGDMSTGTFYPTWRLTSTTIDGVTTYEFSNSYFSARYPVGDTGYVARF